MRKSLDLINQIFGKLKVVGRLESTKQGSIWLSEDYLNDTTNTDEH